MTSTHCSVSISDRACAADPRQTQACMRLNPVSEADMRMQIMQAASRTHLWQQLEQHEEAEQDGAADERKPHRVLQGQDKV